MGWLDSLLKNQAKEYFKGQLMDAVTFCVFALLIKPELGNSPKSLAEDAVKWVLKHPTPTFEDVQSFYGKT
jgi:hypothetical protein